MPIRRRSLQDQIQATSSPRLRTILQQILNNVVALFVPYDPCRMCDQLREEEVYLAMSVVFDDALQDSGPTPMPSELADMAGESATKLNAKPWWRLLYKLCYDEIGMTVLA